MCYNHCNYRWRKRILKKLDPTVKKETLYILSCSLIFSALMQSVFLVCGFWSLKVLFGNLLGVATAVLNFFLLGLTVQSAIELEEKEIKSRMKASQSLRNLMVFAVALIAYLLSDVFHLLAVVIPLFFPRLAIAIRPLVDRNR